jgi:hypothetical protein
MAPVLRPEHQRRVTRRAVRAREPHLTAGRRVRIDRKRARPYDGHGRHTLRSRNLSSTQTFDAAEDEIVAFRCTGKRLLPIFLASFAVPRLALELVRD